MTRYFFDTEFNQERDSVDLLSIGVTCDDGREFYAINGDASWGDIGHWLDANVVPILNGPFAPPYRGEKNCHPTMSMRRIRHELELFINEGPRGQPIEFWGYFADYDWFLLTRLWGADGFRKMPSCFPRICYDVRQYQMHKQVKRLPPALQPAHNALVDARWTAKAFDHVHRHAWPTVET